MPRPRLRWYEDLMLLTLARSPRIHRITVELETDDDLPEDDEDESLDDPEMDFIPYLEHLFRGPSADGHKQN